MNKLSFKENFEDGLAIELLIDGKAVNEIFKCSYPSLPYSYFEDDLPYFPPKKSSVKDYSRRIIGICSCGEYGCKNIRCTVIHEDNKIKWSNFDWVQGSNNDQSFEFDNIEYSTIIDSILDKVKKYEASL